MTFFTLKSRFEFSIEECQGDNGSLLAGVAPFTINPEAAGLNHMAVFGQHSRNPANHEEYEALQFMIFLIS